MITSAEAVIIGTAGVVLGAVISGLTQVLVSARQRNAEREDQRRRAKRIVYESQLRMVMSLSRDMWNAIVSNTGFDLTQEVSSRLMEIRIGVMLDASPEVEVEMKKLFDAVRTWLERVRDDLGVAMKDDGQTLAGLGRESVTAVFDRLSEEIIQPQLKITAKAMAADLR